MLAKLHPCATCGRAASWYRSDARFDFAAVHCSFSDCPEPMTDYRRGQGAAKIWNTRTRPATAPNGASIHGTHDPIARLVAVPRHILEAALNLARVVGTESEPDQRDLDAADALVDYLADKLGV